MIPQTAVTRTSSGARGRYRGSASSQTRRGYAAARWIVSAGRCATSASRSPTAATSAASTACRRRSSAATTSSCRARSCSTSRRSTRLARAFVANGVSKIRITGGEPLVRRDLERLVEMLAALDVDLDADDERHAAAAEGAGARRRGPHARHRQPRLARRRDVPRDERRRSSPSSACSTASTPRPPPACPVKVNAVVKRGLNDHEIVDMARHFRGTGHVLRFIEYMDVGHTNGWRMDDVVPAREIVDSDRRGVPARAGRAVVPRRGRDALALPSTAPARSASSRRSRSRSAATARARASRPKASSTRASSRCAGTTCARCVRSGASDADLDAAIAAIWSRRTDRYSELRSANTVDLPKIEMSYIGG